MKTAVAAKKMDIAGIISCLAMLAAMATLCIRFILAYLAAGAGYYTNLVMPKFSNACVRKRVNNRFVHHRKFALFPG
ncbi:MAG: hypothetical protein JWR54_199 [Mucilaginibacter sp.]|nr:hypothetical protein [Mucilaginibacter sp.]